MKYEYIKYSILYHTHDIKYDDLGLVNDMSYIVLHVMYMTQANTMNNMNMNTNTNTMDNGTQCTYPYWTEAELKIIDEHRNYTYEMMYFIENLEREGPEVRHPKKPKTSLNTLIKNKLPQELKPEFNLHDYLCQNLKPNQAENCPTVSNQIQQGQQFTCLQDILTFLQNGYKLVKIQNAHTLQAYIDYGEWLNVAFELHHLDKLAGRITDTWKQWLETQIGIQESYARKLREIYKLLHHYPRFRSLSLSFSEVYRRRKEIQSMLAINPTAELYWKQP